MVIMFNMPGAAILFLLMLIVLTVYIACSYSDGCLKTVVCAVLLVAVFAVAFYLL